MSHSMIAPSSAHIWGAPGGCRAFPVMAAMHPDEDSQESREGDAMHELGAEGILAAGRGFPVDRPAEVNGITITDEFYDAVCMYVEYCAGIMRENAVFGGPMLRVEEKVHAPQIHELSNGTPDFSLFNRDAGRLYVVDFKGGHDLVEVYENWQEINYYAGLVNEYEIDGYVDQALEVVFVIVQPRGFHRDGPIREWRVKASDLRPYINHLHAGAGECFAPDPLLRSGPHCRYCPARLTCPVGTAAGLSLYESSMRMAVQQMTPAAVGLHYLVVDRALKELTSLHKALGSEVEALTRQGAVVPHWRTEPAYGNEKWTLPDAEVIAIGDQLNADLRTGKPITPNQARAKGVDEALVNSFTTKPRNGWKVVPDNDSKAKRVFS